MRTTFHGRAFAAAAWLVRGSTWLLLAAAGVLFVVATGVYATEIVLRGGFHTSFPEYYEIVGYCFIWIFLLGAGALYGRDEDIVVELVYQRLPEAAGRWLILLVYVGTAVTVAVIFVQTAKVVGLQMNTRTPLLGIPEATKWIPLAIASAAITLSAAVQAWAAATWIATGHRPRVWAESSFDLSE